MRHDNKALVIWIKYNEDKFETVEELQTIFGFEVGILWRLYKIVGKGRYQDVG